MSDDILKKIDNKLSVIVRLLSVFMVENSEIKGIYEKAQKLGTLGLENKMIAEILGTTTNTVSVALSPSKMNKRPKRKARERKNENIVLKNGVKND